MKNMVEFNNNFDGFEKQFKKEEEMKMQKKTEKRIFVQKQKFNEQYPNLSFNDLQINHKIYKKHFSKNDNLCIDYINHGVTNGKFIILHR